ncbi:MAG TPA: hypothetical protein VN421_14025 [Pseudoflavonifractor sp.]|nr:hypothetical protein [Pseudoflavonifractor sp.]
MDEQENSILTDEEELRAAWEAEGPTEEEPEPETAQEQAGEADGREDDWEEESGPDQGGDAFTLKHLDEVKTVNRDEVVVLAQKGMDYDRIRQERDQLRAHRQEVDPALELVRSFASRSGMDLGGYLDYCRKQELTALGYSERGAAAQVAEERRTQARERDMRAFIETYPEVKAESIPAEVWQRVARGDSLSAAYTMYQNRTLEHRLSAERQNRQNRQRTPGGLNHGLVGDRRDEIDKLWYAED